jgi:uncharacterized protein (DUF1697 family)
VSTWIALLRGINVGGHGRLPMKSLVAIFEDCGCANVRTYIQSGNVVFEATSAKTKSLATKISDAIEQDHGFRPAVYILAANKLLSAIANNPFPDAAAEPKSLHLFFLDKPVGAKQTAKIDKLLATSESVRIDGKLVYLHAPDGIGRSKFVRGVDKALGTGTTARNWRTIGKLAEMASAD